LTPRGDFVRQWPAPAWERQSTLDKPYVALDDGGCVYVSDPEGSRVIVFDAAGAPLAVLKGAGSSAFQLPTAVLIDGQGRLWVSDAAGQRLLRFPPVTFSRPCTEH
jgi:streptogramin lyase